jgi:AraC-like DNA-binding protein
MKTIRKKEGFAGQRAIIIPRKILSLQCSNDEVTGGGYITDIGYYPKAKFHYRKRLHGIDQNILIYCIEGTGWVQIGEERFNISSGEFFVVPAKTSHSYAANEDHAWTIYWIHYKGKVFDAITTLMAKELKGYKGSVNYSSKRIELFEEIYSNLERGYSIENFYYSNMCSWYYLSSFLFNNKFSIATPIENRDVSGIAIDFMQQHLNQILTLTEIARSVNLSVSHFAAIFHKRTGFAPIEYFNHLKIQKAAQYLQFTEDRVKEIGNNLGIEDSYYFSRLFKKLMGISPNEYRKRMSREGHQKS